MPAPRLRASPLAVWERDGLKAALRRTALPIDGIDKPDCLFWRFERQDDIPIGFGGLAIDGPDAHLRSLVTLPPMRRQGYGTEMASMLELEARVRGCRAIYVVAPPASEFFSRLGYARCLYGEFPAAIGTSAEFAAQGASAAVMVKRTG